MRYLDFENRICVNHIKKVLVDTTQANSARFKIEYC